MGFCARYSGLLAALMAVACASQTRKPIPLQSHAERWQLDCRAGKAEACYELARYLANERNQGASLSEAIVVLELGCGSGSARSCGLLGAILSGFDDSDAKERGQQLLDGACQRHVSRACVLTARNELAQGAAATNGRPLQRFRTACFLNDAEGCLELGRMYATGAGVAANRERGANYLGMGCELGSAESCSDLATLLDVVGPRDLGRHERLEARACELGRTNSCVWVARHYVHPETGSYDCANGQRLAARACQGKSVEGCGLASICVAQSSSDPTRAQEQLYAACNRGSPSACFYLAQNVQNQPESQRLYVHACQLGSMGGCRAALKGPFDGDRATQLELLGLVERLCERNADACMVLADFYEQGKTVARDPVHARQLRTRACLLGDNDACRDVVPTGDR